jgi:hypothetical protein
MADSDFILIKPVESLHNISGVAPTKHREEQKRRQKPAGQQAPSDPPTEETPPEQPLDREDDPHRIDYCA